MPKSSRYNLLSRIFLLILLFMLSFAASGLWISSAQTGDPCEEIGPTVGSPVGRFPRGATVYVEMDTSFDDNIRNQVTRGFSDWTTANQNNASAIRYQMGAVGAPVNNNQINVVWGTLHNNDGSVDTDTVAIIRVDARNSDGTIRVATLIFNRGATANGLAGGSPYYDSSLLGYDSVFIKKTRHEVGHGQNLNHPTGQQPRGSVMNQSAPCANDNCNQQPTAQDGIQPCDNSAVDNAYPLAAPPPPDGGGGGGQPPCAQHWGMNPIYDREGMVVGYEWVYYGCF